MSAADPSTPASPPGSPEPRSEVGRGLTTSAAERAEALWSAAAELGPANRSALDLHLRYGLDAGSLIPELGPTRNAAGRCLALLCDRLEELNDTAADLAALPVVPAPAATKAKAAQALARSGVPMTGSQAFTPSPADLAPVVDLRTWRRRVGVVAAAAAAVVAIFGAAQFGSTTTTGDQMAAPVPTGRSTLTEPAGRSEPSPTTPPPTSDRDQDTGENARPPGDPSGTPPAPTSGGAGRGEEPAGTPPPSSTTDAPEPPQATEPTPSPSPTSTLPSPTSTLPSPLPTISFDARLAPHGAPPCPAGQLAWVLEWWSAGAASVDVADAGTQTTIVEGAEPNASEVVCAPGGSTFTATATGPGGSAAATDGGDGAPVL
jgi:hypothetical protein